MATLRWRELLSHMGVEWTDRGHNVSRGHIAIRCVWCGASDPSHHLGISEEHGGYRCLRNPAHSGRSAPYLLHALMAQARRHEDVDELITRFGGERMAPRILEAPPPVEPTPFTKRWASFTSAARDAAALDYLASRGFANPGQVARDFDLRVGRGRWATRLWFPLTYADEVVGYTGRSMVGGMPRYLTETADAVLYLPAPPTPQQEIALLVEGPIDALKLAEVAKIRYDKVLVAALCGSAVSPTRRYQLLALGRSVKALYAVFDSTVDAVTVNRFIADLKPVVLHPLALPAGVEDPGDLSHEAAGQWLANLVS